MSLQDSLFSEDVEYDVTEFSKNRKPGRVLIFPPVNNYRRFIIHQLVQDRFADLLHTFSIGQGAARRTVVCYKSDVISDPKSNGVEHKSSNPLTKPSETFHEMGVGEHQSSSISPVRGRSQRQGKAIATAEIYRPPAARRLKNNGAAVEPVGVGQQSNTDSLSISGKNRQKRPDRAVYVPRHRRSLDTEGSPQPVEHQRSNCTNLEHSASPVALSGTSNSVPNSRVKSHDTSNTENAVDGGKGLISCTNDNGQCNESHAPETKPDTCANKVADTTSLGSREPVFQKCNEDLPQEVDKLEVLNLLGTIESSAMNETDEENVENREEPERRELNECVKENKVDDGSLILENKETVTKEIIDSPTVSNGQESVDRHNKNNSKCKEKRQMVLNTPDKKQVGLNGGLVNNKSKHKRPIIKGNMMSDVLIISENDKREASTNVINNKELSQTKNCVISMTPPGKKAKKIERLKSKPAPPPSPPPVKVNRDECDWDALFDDNGDCLDPTLIEELTSAVGDVVIEQPKSDYKAYTKQVEVSSDEYAHVLEIYNFPSDFKTSDLAAVFSPFKNGGFELKWVDDTHCLGVFSSPLIAAEVLASNHPFVKTRPLSEATALSKTKARRSADFLQPYRSRPETCAALARRLVTGALGVRLATASQEREREKMVLREAKEKRRLANKQREDAWEGIIPGK